MKCLEISEGLKSEHGKKLKNKIIIYYFTFQSKNENIYFLNYYLKVLLCIIFHVKLTLPVSNLQKYNLYFLIGHSIGYSRNRNI